MLYIIIRKTMSRFLKLTNMLLNVNQIRLIYIKPDEYIIKMIAHQIKGYFMFGSGGFESDDNYINICKKENLEDYKIITDWILSGKNNNGEMK
jgi:hypothetical protein